MHYSVRIKYNESWSINWDFLSTEICLSYVNQSSADEIWKLSTHDPIWDTVFVIGSIILHLVNTDKQEGGFSSKTNNYESCIHLE